MKPLTKFLKKHGLICGPVSICVMLLATSCNFTPGVPIPPPPRENFSVMEVEVRCDGQSVVEVISTPNTFEAGELVLITNMVTRYGIVAPVENDGSIQVKVPAADGEGIAIRRRTAEGDESMPVDCKIPADPVDHSCDSVM